jgi:hypothetical protein
MSISKASLVFIVTLLAFANVVFSEQATPQDQGSAPRDIDLSTEWIAMQKKTLDAMDKEKQIPYLLSLEKVIDGLFLGQQHQKDKALSWLGIALYTRQCDEPALKILSGLTNASKSDLYSRK